MVLPRVNFCAVFRRRANRALLTPIGAAAIFNICEMPDMLSKSVTLSLQSPPLVRGRGSRFFRSVPGCQLSPEMNQQVIWLRLPLCTDALSRFRDIS